MTQIKSEIAEEYINIHYGFLTSKSAKNAVIIAETEAEQRHAKELQELRDKAIKTHCHCCEWREVGCPKDSCISLKVFTQRLNK